MTATLTQYIAVAGVVEPAWIERSYGRHSNTRHLDDPAVHVTVLLEREGYTHTPSSRSARRADT